MRVQKKRFGHLILLVAVTTSISQVLHSQKALAGRGTGDLRQPPTAKRSLFVAPDDPDFFYSEFVDADINSTRAAFGRPSINGLGDTNSPGTRINFTTDAQVVEAKFNYISTFGSPGGGTFRLEIDGVLHPDFIGSDTDLGARWYPVVSHSTVQRREYSLILPYRTEVEFQGLELTNGSLGLLSPPPERPLPLCVAYGDSITHGFDATSIATSFPYQVGELLESRVINMGFAGRTTTPRDGAAIASLNADRILVAIGINDYIFSKSLATFQSDYEDFLDFVRLVQPSVPLFAITPAWMTNEAVLNGVGEVPESYRQVIRDVVLLRADTDPLLFLIEGSVLFPPDTLYLDDFVHPNDAGFALYGQAVAGSNLLSNASFEIDPFAWQDLGGTQYGTASPNTGLQSLEVSVGSGAIQPVGRLERGEDYVLGAWTRIGSGGESGSFGITFYDSLGGALSSFIVNPTWTTFQKAQRFVSSPAQFAYAEVWCQKLTGSSVMYVDDVSLTKFGTALSKTYGNGRAGARGAPSISASAAPVVGTEITIEVGNPLEEPVLGWLFFSAHGAPSSIRPSLLEMPAPGSFTMIPPAGLRWTLSVPEHVGNGAGVLLRSVQLDLSGSWSESAILSLTAGDRAHP